MRIEPSMTDAELFNFEPKVLDSGNIRYGGEGSYHDDLVMTLCLAYTKARFVPRVPWVEYVPFNPVEAYGDPRERQFKWHDISR
jgi:hypothetical protein